MTDIDRLDQRLSAVERVVVDDDVAVDELAELTSLASTVSDLEAHLEEQEQRIADLEAAVQSIEGYVGNVESINDDVERQAASAVATVDRLESRVNRLEVELDDVAGGILEDGNDEEAAAAAEPVEDAADEQSEAAADDDAEEGAVFEFDDADVEPSPEQSVSQIVDGEDRPRSTDGAGSSRPVSPANQSTVDAAIGGDSSSTNEDRTADGREDDDEGLFDSLRSRLS